MAADLKVKVLDLDGKETSTVAVKKHATNPMLIKKVYQGYLNSLRTAHAKVKKRDEVRGGGRKPWRQKGTGRARIGSTRAPHWIGGGQVWGPTGEENYRNIINPKARKKAFFDAVNLKAQAGFVSVIEELPMPDKSKEANIMIGKLIGDQKGRIVVVVDDATKVSRGFANLKNITVLKLSALTIKALVDSDLLILVGTTKKILGRTK